MPMLVDTAYLDRVSGRIEGLQGHEASCKQDTDRTQRELVRAMTDIDMELQALRAELAGLEADLHTTVGRARNAVALFKSVVKKGDLQRLQNRADAWAPESRITREQFKRMLHDAFSA